MKQFQHRKAVKDFLFLLWSNDLNAFAAKFVCYLEIVLCNVLVDIDYSLFREPLPFDNVSLLFDLRGLPLIYYLLYIYAVFNEYDIPLFDVLNDLFINACPVQLAEPGDLLAHLRHHIVVICHPLLQRQLVLRRIKVGWRGALRSLSIAVRGEGCGWWVLAASETRKITII